MVHSRNVGRYQDRRPLARPTQDRRNKGTGRIVHFFARTGCDIRKLFEKPISGGGKQGTQPPCREIPRSSTSGAKNTRPARLLPCPLNALIWGLTLRPKR